MGWASGGEIFDATARVVLRQYSSGIIGFFQSVEILGVLARSLRDGDWDTEGESLGEFDGHPVVRDALKYAGWEPYEDEEK